MTSAPPPLHHQPYSHPHPSTSGFLAPPQVHQRHYSDYDQHQAPPPEAMYGSSPGVSSSFGFDPAGQPTPAGQLYPSQYHYQPQTPRSSNTGLVPSTAHLYPPADYHHRSSHESHRSHHSHHSRPRSSSNQSHMSHRSHHSHHSHRSDREDKRPTLGDTLMLIWDSFWGAWSPRNK